MCSSLVALTGGTGFVGSHVAEALLAAGYRVRALVRRPEDPGWLKGLDVELARGDVRDPSALGSLVTEASAVVHAAGKTSARNEAEYFATNAGGTARMVEATLGHSPQAHFVLISSLSAAGPSRDGTPVRVSDPPHPVSSYGRSKLAGEDALRSAAGLAFTILRPAAVYGPRETAIRDMFVSTSRGLVPLLAGGRLRIQLVYVGDLAAATVRAVGREGKGETFFLAHPEVLDYRLIAETLARLPSKKPRIIPVPAAVIRAAGWATSLASAFSSRPPVFSGEKAREMLQPAWLCDVSKAQVELGQPFQTEFGAGARLTWDWYQTAGWIRG